MLAVHLDNLLFLLFLGIAFFFQLLTRAARKTGQRPEDTTRRSTSPSQRSRPLVSESDETDQERIRKFLEALGQPATSKPPEPSRPRPTYQEPVVLPPPPALPREIRLPGQIPPTRTAKTFRPKVSETPFEVRRETASLESPPVIKTAAEAYAIATQPVSKPREGRIDIAAMLRSTSGLRDAIILREIFGPPRSMQPLDLVGSI